MKRLFMYVCKVILASGFFFFITPAIAQNQKDTVAQRDLIDYVMKLFNSKQERSMDEDSRKVRFTIVPASNPGQDRLSISAINMGFYRGDPATTNMSSVYFYPYTNFSGRYSFSILSNVWSDKNKWNATGDFKISSNSYDDYGLGSRTSSDSATVLDYNHSRIRIEISRLVVGFFYAGLGYYLDTYEDISQESPEGVKTDFDNYQFNGSPSFTSSGLVLNLKRDSRKNSINPQGGYYTNLSFRFYKPFTGSTYSWNAIYADVRKYFPIQTKRRSILATRALYWQTMDEVPYLELPATFNDRESRVGRGYGYSRFRGKAMLYGEAEYRFSLTPRKFWGMVLFVNAQSLREPDSGNFERINPAAGFGFRIKFNKRSNSNLTIDFAFGKDSFGWSMNIGEFF